MESRSPYDTLFIHSTTRSHGQFFLKQILSNRHQLFCDSKMCTIKSIHVRGRSQLSTFMKAYTAYARGEGVWDLRTLFLRKSTFNFNH